MFKHLCDFVFPGTCANSSFMALVFLSMELLEARVRDLEDRLHSLEPRALSHDPLAPTGGSPGARGRSTVQACGRWRKPRRALSPVQELVEEPVQEAEYAAVEEAVAPSQTTGGGLQPVQEAVAIFMKLAVHALSEARLPQGHGKLAKASTCLKEAQELFMGAVGPLPTTRQSAEAYSKVREAQKLVGSFSKGRSQGCQRSSSSDPRVLDIALLHVRARRRTCSGRHYRGVQGGV